MLSADNLCKQFVPRPVESNYLNSVLIDLVALDSHIEGLFPIAIFTSRTGITFLLIVPTFRASINFQIQEVQTSYPWNFEVPLNILGSPIFFCDTVAVWGIVKLALKNKIYISGIILCSLQDR